MITMQPAEPGQKGQKNCSRLNMAKTDEKNNKFSRLTMAPCSGAGILIFFGRFGHIQAVALLSFPAVLAIFRPLLFYYFRLFWPCSGGCPSLLSGRFDEVQTAAFFIISSLFGLVQEAALLFFFGRFWPCLGSCIFIVVGRFGHVQAAAFSLFLAALPIFRLLHFYYYWPFWPCSGGTFL